MKAINRHNEPESIEAIAPRLSRIPKLNPFNVPAGYFEALPSAVMQRCPGSSRVVAEQRTTAPFPFHVPDDYFETFSSRLHEKIRSSRPSGNVVRLPLSTARMALAAAAALILFSVLFGISRWGTPKYEQQMAHAEISASDIENSIYLYGVDQHIIAEELDDELRNAPGRKESEIENYLIENQVDLSTLISEL